MRGELLNLLASTIRRKEFQSVEKATTKLISMRNALPLAHEVNRADHPGNRALLQRSTSQPSTRGQKEGEKRLLLGKDAVPNLVV
jgi:hypothetical protein